jgi:hypothetical protein
LAAIASVYTPATAADADRIGSLVKSPHRHDRRVTPILGASREAESALSKSRFICPRCNAVLGLFNP